MEFKLLNIIGKNFTGGSVKLIQEKEALFFSSSEYLISFNIFKKKLKTFDFGLKSFILSFDIQKNGSFAIILSENCCGLIFDLAVKKIKAKITFKNQYLKAKWSPNKNIFTVSSIKYLQIWKISRSKGGNFFEFFFDTYFKFKRGYCN